MPVKGKSPSTGTLEDNAYTTSTPSSEERRTQKQSVIAASVLRSNGETSSGRSPRCENSTPAPEIVTDVAGGLNWKRKGLISILDATSPREISSRLWLPIGTGSPDSGLNSSSGWSSKTAERSWFSTSRMPVPNPNSPRIYSPSSILSSAGCTDSGATDQQSRRIRVYPTTQQKLMLRTWLDASRWTYNLTVEILKSGTPASWKTVATKVMAEVKRLRPEWEPVPYQVKRTSVRDACRAMSNVKKFNKRLAAAKAKGERLDEDFAELHFRSRKNPRQSCYIPDDAVSSQRRLPHDSRIPANGRRHS